MLINVKFPICYSNMCMAYTTNRLVWLNIAVEPKQKKTGCWTLAYEITENARSSLKNINLTSSIKIRSIL